MAGNSSFAPGTYSEAALQVFVVLVWKGYFIRHLFNVKCQEIFHETNEPVCYSRNLKATNLCLEWNPLLAISKPSIPFSFSLQAIAIMLPVATCMLIYAYRSLRAFRRQQGMDCDMEPPPPPTPGTHFNGES